MATIEPITFITAIVGVICGLIGTVLGTINTFDRISKNRVRLKVVPKVAIDIDRNNVMTFDRITNRIAHLISKGIPYRLCIEVINLSVFPVTISDIGFGKTDKLRHILFQPELTTGKTWPARLEPRESVVAYAKSGQKLDIKVMKKAVAYTTTDCGVTRYGTSPIFKKYVQELYLKSGTGEGED